MFGVREDSDLCLQKWPMRGLASSPPFDLPTEGMVPERLFHINCRPLLPLWFGLEVWLDGVDEDGWLVHIAVIVCLSTG